MQKKTKTEVLSIPMIDKRVITFSIKGTVPLIVHKFSEKARKMMMDIMQKKVKVKELKNEEQEYLNSLYFFEDGKRTGFPAVGFKAGMVRAAKQTSMNMTDARGMFHVIADEGDLIEIKGTYKMRSDMVRVANGGADIRFRAEYPEWTAKIKVIYNATSISSEQIANLINIAGFSCGIGEWRPEKCNAGNFGMYELVND